MKVRGYGVCMRACVHACMRVWEMILGYIPQVYMNKIIITQKVIIYFSLTGFHTWDQFSSKKTKSFVLAHLWLAKITDLSHFATISFCLPWNKI